MASPGTLTFPAAAPFNSAAAMQGQSISVDFAMPTRTVPADSARRIVIAAFPGFAIELWETDEACATDLTDQMPLEGTRSCSSLAGHPDVTIRVTRDTAAMTFLLQAFDRRTGQLIGANSASGSCGNRPAGCRISTRGGISWAGSIPVSATLAWLKIRLGPPSQYPVASGEATPADAADFRFEGGLVNQASGQYGVTFAHPAPAYVPSPSYPPICSAGPTQTVRAGVDPLVLDGTGSYALNGDAPLSYSWSRTAGPGNILLSGQATARPSGIGAIFGTHTLQLTVTDSSGQTASCTVDHGAVAADRKGVLLPDKPQFEHLISGLMPGKSPWPWFDLMASQTGRLFVGKLSGQFLPIWRNASPHGTISVPKSSTPGVAIAGTGTLFAADFFGGSCANSWNGVNLIVWYPGPGYRYLTPTKCADDTHLTVREPTYFLPGPVVNSQYAVMNQGTELANWIGGSNNANYYDNSLAYFTNWLQTGLEYWHAAARTLADRWWESPGIDQGRGCWDGGFPGLGLEGYWCPPPRVWAIFGLMLRAVERPDMWPGLYLMLDKAAANSTTGPITDTRENSAQMGQVCTAAMFMQELGLDPVRVARYKTFCAGMVRMFASKVRPHGEFLSPQYGLTSNNNGYSTVTLTAGSRTVTAAKADFPCSSLILGTGDGASRFWAVADNSIAALADPQLGDTMTYAVDACTPGALTLHTPYAGALAGSGRGYSLNLIGGASTQPFIMGYVAGQLDLASQALTVLGDNATAGTAHQLVNGLANWIVNPVYGGIWPATGGLYYVRNGLTNDVGCEPNPEKSNGNTCTAGNDVQSSRFLAGETFRGISHADLSDSLKAAGDGLFGRMYGGLGGPGSDGTYLSGFYPDAESGKAKDFGFCCGLGGDSQWAAARLGGADPFEGRSLYVPFKMPAGAVSATLTVVRPSGLQQVTACASSPCAATLDARQGGHWISLAYLDASGAQILAGKPVFTQVQ